MNFFTKLFYEKFKRVISSRKNSELHVTGVSDFFLGYFIFGIQELTENKIVILFSTEDECESFLTNLNYYFSNGKVFPFYDEFLDHLVQTEVRFERVRLLDDLIKGKIKVLAMTVMALFSTVINKKDFISKSINLGYGQIPKDFLKSLISIGYEKKDEVSCPGEFSVRGDIIDIFSPNCEPTRIEIFNYAIEKIRSFDLSTQRTIAKIDSISIIPVNDFLKEFKTSNIIEYFNEDTLFFVYEPKKIKNSLKNEIKEKFIEFCNTQSVINLHDIYVDVLLETEYSINFKIKNVDSKAEFTKIKNKILDNKTLNDEVVLIFARNSAHLKLICEELENCDVCVNPNLDGSINNGVYVVVGEMNVSFKSFNPNFTLISFCSVLKREKTHKVKRESVNIFELVEGDLVVHEHHGVCRYLGVERLSVMNINKDYLKLCFRDGDFLHVPVDQLDVIYKYLGPTVLNRLGGSEWNKIRQKVKDNCKLMAENLIKLYAERESLTGIKFEKDKDLDRSFEESFPYEETEDQIRCIKEIKDDMERDRPMERLLCGDAGYGKTEVAMRAAFKAVVQGYQVAYLAPTTILANQHYETFKNRMEDFGINVELFSRFQTSNEQKLIVKKLKRGQIDVIIGTHRLIQKDVEFNKLGFLIVDEEQRFGVMHKERIKELCKNVDTLMLSATPIPRTLYLSMSGIRDMSILKNPPKERKPVRTYCLEYDVEILKNAILKETARGGQVYYLHNRISSIYKVLKFLKELIPNIRISAIHGQMEETEIEDTIFKFLTGEIDVLVSTTIIEIGIDIPNANTIIIENADKMGLSQLYQLRGRVGRSSKTSYAYLTFKKEKVLTEVAEKRLKTIKEFTDFGSGLKIAMKDLEIRGAGSVVGTKQHGHVELVGYEMYCKLLKNAVEELKGSKSISVNTTIDLPISSYIDDKYISSDSSRLESYKKIATIENIDDLSEISSEFEDRFGSIPKNVMNLMKISLIKKIANNLNIKEINGNKDEVIFYFLKDEPLKINPSVLLYKYKNCVKLINSQNPHLKFNLKKEDDQYLEKIFDLLQKLSED